MDVQHIWVNLLAQDITPIFIINYVVEVQRYFTNNHEPAAGLKELSDIVKLQLLSEPRCNIQIECISTFISCIS